MKYNPCEPGETMLKFMFISVFTIGLSTLAISGLIFLTTRDGILTAVLVMPIAIVVVAIYVAFWARRIDSARGL